MPKSKVLEFRPMAKIHLHELKAIWPADPRIPSPASRRAWSLARKISPARVNSWWYNRKREAKRLRIKIPRNEEYELPIGEPPEIPEDHVNLKEEAVDQNIPLVEGVTTEPRGDANPPRLRSEESVDVPLDVVCARNRAFVDLSLEWASDSGMLDYASSDTACSPVPESGSVNKIKLRLDDYASNFGGSVEWNTFEDSSIQVVLPRALDPPATRTRQLSARNMKLQLDDNAVDLSDTGEWSIFDDNNMHAVSREDLASPDALDSAASHSRAQLFNKATLGLTNCASKPGRSGEWSSPENNTIGVVSTEDSASLDSTSLRICNQGVTASGVPPFTCSLCSCDCISPINDEYSPSSLVTNTSHAVACPTGVSALEIRRDYIRLYNQYYSRDGWLLDADDLDHISDADVNVDPAFPLPS